MDLIHCTANKPCFMPEFLLEERDLIEPFTAALRNLPDVKVEPPRKLSPEEPWTREVDAIVDVVIHGKPVTLLVEAKRAGYPRDVRQAVWQLRNYAHHVQPRLKSQATVLFFITEALSPGAKEFLAHEKIGYFDLGGSLYLPAPGAYLYIDKPSPKREARMLRSLFVGKRADVLHFAFFQRDWFGVTELAQKSGVSAATVSEVLSELDRREWVESRGQGPSKERRLIDTKALLDAWKTHQLSTRPLKLHRYYVSSSGVGPLMRRLSIEGEKHHLRYVVTGEVAAQHYAPYLSSISQVRCRMLETDRTRKVLQKIEARPVNEGWNLGIIESKSNGDFAFSERIEGVWMASPLRAYLDLLQGDGRAKEMAEHLRRERLKV